MTATQQPDPFGTAGTPAEDGETHEWNVVRKSGGDERAMIGQVPLAGWLLRGTSAVIDYMVVPVMAFYVAWLLTAGWAVAVNLIPMAAFLWSVVWLQGRDGRSLGKRVVGSQLVAVVRDEEGRLAVRSPGRLRCLERAALNVAIPATVVLLGLVLVKVGAPFAAVLFMCLAAGYALGPVVGSRRRTLADVIAKTVVVHDHLEVHAIKPSDVPVRIR